MLDDLCWWKALADRQGLAIDVRVQSLAVAATRWLSAFVDPENGRVPNYGANDGANILPLSCSDYLDYRPTLQAADRLFHANVFDLGNGPWTEKTIWLGGETAKKDLKREGRTKESKPLWSAKEGGYFILQARKSRLFVRATKYKDRPSQCDQLHVDLWYRGVNVLRDTGSYLYYHHDPSVKNYFYSVHAHNTVQIGQRNQMTKGPNFLWFHWSKGYAEELSEIRLRCIADFFGSSPYQHVREIVCHEEGFAISDQVGNSGPYKAYWHLAPELEWRETRSGEFMASIEGNPFYRIRFEGSSEITCNLVNGWESLYYGERHEIPVLQVEVAGGVLHTELRAADESGTQRN